MLLPSNQLQPLPPHSSETETDACLLQSSPLPFTGAVTSMPSHFPNSIPPSPSLEPEPDDLEQIRPFLVTPGTYVFKSITPTVTCLLPKDSGSPSQAIYHILTERLAISQVMLITIRQGPPDKGGKAVATFELDGRDTIIISGKRYNRSKIFSVVPGITSKYTRQLFCEFGDVCRISSSSPELWLTVSC
ncbi:hypothetical protein DL96DRAFT_1624037 [Flagelloscypha sp. PMI_526]|nr:hypothetical protein DL96DRAFT_1624037 [Flagelloscypha sp. PMI_526]